MSDNPPQTAPAEGSEPIDGPGPVSWARSLSLTWRVGLLLAAAVVVLVIALLVPPIPQDPAYHLFAEQRALWGIPNFGDVISNVCFLAVGVLGLAFLLERPRPSPPDPLRLPFLIYFAGIGLIALGSGTYHADPGNGALFWDRLPMTIAFMALFAAIIADRIDARAGLLLLPLLLILGGGSVVYWHFTEAAGGGDLRFYAVVQFFPILAIPLICLMFPRRRLDGRWIAAMAGFYTLAKVFEHFDQGIFQLLGGIASGHSLKHLIAALAAYMALPMLKRAARPPA